MSDTTQSQTLELVRLALIRASENRKLGEILAADQLWTGFFEQYNNILRGFAHKAKCPRGSIDEVVCLVWYDVLKDLPRFEYDPARGGFRRQLYRIVQRTAIEEARRRGRRREVSLDAQTTNFWYKIVDPRSANKDDLLTNLYRRELVRSILESFAREAPTKVQEVFQRCFFEAA